MHPVFFRRQTVDLSYEWEWEICIIYVYPLEFRLKKYQGQEC